MVDSFPSSTAGPEHIIQLRIDEDLGNAQRLNADFEKEFPEDPAAKVRTLMERSLQRPRTNALYPRLAAAKEPQKWLMPLMRRFAWNHGRGEAGAAWAGMLAEMVRLTLSQAQGVSEQEFVSLALVGEALMARRTHGYLGFMESFACGLERAGPLPTAAVATWTTGSASYGRSSVPTTPSMPPTPAGARACAATLRRWRRRSAPTG
jgi:hypothetical protein